MSHCVPSWDQNPNQRRRKVDALHASSIPISSTLGVTTLDYEVAELTWKNGQVAMHGFGVPRVVNKPHVNTTAVTKYTWEKPRAAETLEAIVNQAALLPHRKTQTDVHADDLVPWLSHQTPAIVSGVVSSSATMTMDALVPSPNDKSFEPQSQEPVSGAGGAAHCSTRVGSCSVGNLGFVDQRVVRDGGGGGSASAAHEWSSCRDQSASGSATFGMESSHQLTVETGERDLGMKGLTSASTGSPENTTSGKQSTKSTSPDEHDSVCHSRPQKNAMEEKKKGKVKSSISTKRSRAAAIHNQSERKRRDKINQKMKTLQKLVPNANKTDKASMLDEVIEYLKQLQAQVHMMSRMNMSPLMMPFAMQQLQMAMMSRMGMGMGMDMGMGMAGVMDLNNIPGMAPAFHPPTFMQPTMASWDVNATNDRIPNHNDPMVAFLGCQSQPMTMEAYSRMAAMFQQMPN